MLNEGQDLHPMSRILAGSPYFGHAEPIVDIADAPGDLYLALARTIEREVIPRLLLNTRLEVAKRNPPSAVSKLQGSADVVAFCRIILTAELSDAASYVAREMAAGSTSDRLLLDLFAPTARRLGELWETDECSFVDVTIALGRLQQLPRLFSETYQIEPDPKKLGFRALLATVPDNQHVFGIFMVEELFRRSGWNVLSLPSPDRSELIETIAREWFAVVGLSISCDSKAETLPSLIAEIRQASLNRSVLVLVGGRYVTDNPEQAARWGADLVGADAREAIERSQDYLRTIGR